MEEKTLSLQQNPKVWRLFCWALYNVTNNVFMIPWMFASFAAAGGYGIAIAVAGFIATGARVLDAVTDPLCAFLLDNFPLKWGRHRIGGTVGLIGMIVGTMGAFSWGIPTKSLAVYIAFYVVYTLGRTLFGIGCEGSVNNLTSDPSQRQLTGRFSAILQIAPTTLLGSYMSIILVGKYGGMSLPMFAELGYTCCAIAIVCWIFAFIAISPYDKPDVAKSASANQSGGFKKMFDLARHNKALWAVIGAATSDKLAQQMAGDGLVVTMIFGIIIGDYAIQGKLNLVSMIPMILIVLFSSKLRFRGKWADNKNQLLVWCWLAIAVSAVCAVFVAVFNQNIGASTLLQAVLLVLLCINSGVRAMSNVCNSILFYDVVDYEYYRSGAYLPATVGAVRSFVDKLISSLATTFTSLAVAAIGYTRIAPAIDDPMTPQIVIVALLLWMGAPVLGFLISVISMKFYPIEGELAQKVRESSMERRKAVMANAAQKN